MPRSPIAPEPEDGPGETARVADARATPVHVASGNRPFGELTLDDVKERARELGSVGTFGPLQRVRPVARGWSELAAEMESRQIASVGELDEETLLDYAERLWVVAPPEGLI